MMLILYLPILLFFLLTRRERMQNKVGASGDSSVGQVDALFHKTWKHVIGSEKGVTVDISLLVQLPSVLATFLAMAALYSQLPQWCRAMEAKAALIFSEPATDQPFSYDSKTDQTQSLSLGYSL